MFEQYHDTTRSVDPTYTLRNSRKCQISKQSKPPFLNSLIQLLPPNIKSNHFWITLKPTRATQYIPLSIPHEYTNISPSKKMIRAF